MHVCQFSTCVPHSEMAFFCSSDNSIGISTMGCSSRKKMWATCEERRKNLTSVRLWSTSSTSFSAAAEEVEEEAEDDDDDDDDAEEAEEATALCLSVFCCLLVFDAALAVFDAAPSASWKTGETHVMNVRTPSAMWGNTQTIKVWVIHCDQCCTSTHTYTRFYRVSREHGWCANLTM